MAFFTRLVAVGLALSAPAIVSAGGKLGPIDPRLDSVSGMESLYCEGSVRILLDGASTQSYLKISEPAVVMKQSAKKTMDKAVLFKGRQSDNPEG